MKIITKNILFSATIALLCNSGFSAELTHNFSSPSFSGIGYGNHVLTLKQLEDQQKEKNKAAADALKAKAEAEAANTPQAKFVANLESRIYSQLAKQITDSLFGTDGVPSCSSANPYSQCGSIDIAGNNITWRLGNPNLSSERGMIVINIVGTGGTAEMKVPSGTFYF